MSAHDAIVVGGRCAGSTAAMRLARAGWDVVMVDRDDLGSDTLSTHAVFPNTVARLDELGVLRRLLERHRVPPMEQALDVLGRRLIGGWEPIGGHDRALVPRRVVLDRAFAETAIEAGVDARFGERVTGLLGAGTDREPVRGVVLESGERLEAPWVIAADGRASTIAGKLGLERERPMAGNMAFLLAYWSGLPPTDAMWLVAREEAGLNRLPCEDGIELVVAVGPPALTRGGSEARERAYTRTIRSFPDVIDPGAFEDAERISEVRAAPETIMRGFFRRATGPGWALVGDAGHFKHPGTAQGISDAVEQALYVADALTGAGPGIETYPEWRDARAAGHYEFSFQMGTMPRAEVAGPIFDGLLSEPGAEQEFRDTMTRTRRPDEVLSPERLAEWFAAVPAR